MKLRSITLILLFVLAIILFMLPALKAQTDQWVEMESMITARDAYTSAVLDGKIYVIGGLIHRDSTAVRTVEVYDPSLNKWTLKNDFPVPISAAGAETVNGKLYAFGGSTCYTCGDTQYDSVYVYDPDMDEWSTVGTMPNKNGIPASTTLGNKIYVVGGFLGSTPLSQTLSYDPVSNTWENIAFISPNRFSTALVSKDDKLYAMWGSNHPNVYNELQVLDTINNSWDNSPEAMPEKRLFAGAVVVKNKIFVMPGAKTNPIEGVFDMRTFIYDITNDTWSVDPIEVPEPVIGSSIHVIDDTTLYLISGFTPDWWNESGGPVVSGKVWKREVVVGTREIEEKSLIALDVNPNPASDWVNLRYQIPSKGTVQLQLSDLQGRIVEEISQPGMAPGEYSIKLNTSKLLSGIYICTMRWEGIVTNRKIVIDR